MAPARPGDPRRAAAAPAVLRRLGSSAGGRRDRQARRSRQAGSAVETGRLAGLVAAHNVTALFSLLAKSGSPDTARANTIELLSALEVAPVDGHVLERAQALALPYRDLEDAVQMAAARQAGTDYQATKDRAGYAAGP